MSKLSQINMLISKQISTILYSCQNCKKQETEFTNTHEEEAAHEAYEDGWRCDNPGKLYCPECAEKNNIQ